MQENVQFRGPVSKSGSSTVIIYVLIHLATLCSFTFQALVSYAKEMGLLLSKDNATKNPKGLQIIKHLIPVALLPPNKIEEGVQEVISLIKLNFESNEIILNAWMVYINEYIYPHWMESVTPEFFSVFGQIDRTNNHSESHNKICKTKITTKPTCHSFLCK